MKGSPSTLSMRPRPGTDYNLYVFVRGDDGHLYTCFFKERGHKWKWKDLGTPSRLRRVNSNPSASIGYIRAFGDPEAIQYARIFVRGNNGHIFECEWSGEENENPTWLDRGQPSRAYDAVYHPSTTSSELDSGLSAPPTTVFTLGADSQIWYTYAQNWLRLPNIPRPGVAYAFGDPGAFSDNHWNWVYIIGNDRNLYCNITSRVNPNLSWWYNLGSPPTISSPGLLGYRRPALINDPTRLSNLGRNRSENGGPSAYVVGGGKIWELQWNLQAVSWHEIGKPDEAILNNSCAVINYYFGFNKPYLFTVGDNGAMYSCTLPRQGSRKWSFHNHHDRDGLPLLKTTGIDDRLAVVNHGHYVGNDKQQWLYSFAISIANELVSCHWNRHNGRWEIGNLGKPPSE